MDGNWLWPLLWFSFPLVYCVQVYSLSPFSFSRGKNMPIRLCQRINIQLPFVSFFYFLLPIWSPPLWNKRQIRLWSYADFQWCYASDFSTMSHNSGVEKILVSMNSQRLLSEATDRMYLKMHSGFSFVCGIHLKRKEVYIVSF